MDYRAPFTALLYYARKCKEYDMNRAKLIKRLLDKATPLDDNNADLLPHNTIWVERDSLLSRIEPMIAEDEYIYIEEELNSLINESLETGYKYGLDIAFTLQDIPIYEAE